MPDEAGFHVARAYVTVEPDAADFPEKLKAQLEENQFRLRVPVAPEMGGFREEMQAGLDAEKGQDVKVDVEPDPTSLADLTPRIQAFLDARKAAAEVNADLSPDAAAKISAELQAELDKRREALVGAGLEPGAADKLIADLQAQLTAGPKPTLDIKANLDEASLAASVAEARSELGDLKVGDDLFAAFSRTGANSFIATYAKDLEDLTGPADDAAGALGRTAKAADAAGEAAKKSDQAFRIYGIGISKLAVHGVVTGLIDFLAVAIPAAAAAGAWAAAWSRGAEQVEQHMVALHTATSATNAMFGETTGSALGLGGALSKAQEAARPQVFEALGAAINIAKERMGDFSQVGLQVGQVFDNFMAKLVYDFSAAGGAGNTFGGLLSNMVPDLTQLGEVLGNLGHALGSFAAQMPGVAEMLLGMLAGATHLATGLIDLSGKFSVAGVSALTLIMAFHEFDTWGSIAVAALRKFGLATSEVSGGFFSLERAGGVLSNIWGAIPTLVGNIVTSFGGLTRGVGSVTSGLGSMVSNIGKSGNVFSLLGSTVEDAGGKVDKLGVNIGGLGSDLEEGAAGVGAWQVALAAAGAAGLAFLTYKLLTAKTAAQQFADSLQTSVDKVSNIEVIGALGNSMATLSQKTGQATAAMNANAAGAKYAGGVQGRYTDTVTGVQSAYQRAAMAAGAYTDKQQQMAQQFVTVGAHATALANTYHTSLVGALALADQAGVHLNQTLTKQAWAMAQIKIADLVQGYKAMGAPMGAVGNDMAALAIQSGLAATKVDQLNQAWDQFMQNLTGGTSGLATFEESLENMGHVVADTANHLGNVTGGTTIGMKKFAESLTTFTGKGAQAWSNFDQTVSSSAPQLIDWLRTAGAEGALSGKDLSHGLTEGTTAAKNFQQGILDMISQLTPLASKSKDAQGELVGLAQQAGLNIQTFPQLTAAIAGSHASVKNLQDIVSQATIKMGNMSAVAQQLGNVLQTDVISAMDAAKLRVSGVAAATVAYTQDIRNGTATTAAGQAARATLIKDLEFAGLSAKAAAALVRTYAGNVANAGNNSQAAAGKVHDLGNALNVLHGKTIDVNVIFKTTGKPVPGGLPGSVSPFGAGGGVIPGYAPGKDIVPLLASPGEALLVPEAVRAIGPKAIHAINRRYGRGRKSSPQLMAGGGIVTESAQFGFPQDVFNFQIGPIGFGGSTTTVGGGGQFTGFQQLADELKGFKTAGAKYPNQSDQSYQKYLDSVKKDNASRFAQMEADGKKLVAAFSEGTLTTVSAIKAEAADALRTLQTYYKGPAATRLEQAITRQTASMEKLATASAKVATTIANMKAFSAQEVQSLQGFSNISNITGTTNATTGVTAPPTGAQIKAGLQKMLAQLRQFESIIKKLKAAKVATVMIEQVIALGPEQGIQYGQAILAGGSTLIAQINKTEKAITGEETVIGHTSAEIQYGQSITKGFLSSLEKKESELKKKMQTLGDEIAKELAKALGVPLSVLKKDEGIGKAKLNPPKPKGPVVTPPHIIYQPPVVHPDVKTANVKQDIHITVNSPKGYFSPEQLAAIKHEISVALSLSH